MRILISNDDGIDAPGIRVLAAAVADLGEVIIVAPDTVQSGAGHGITVHHPLMVREVDVPVEVDGRVRAVRGYSVDGRPADCVRLAVKTLLAEPVDLVLSGINKGANDGICVFYSGTVAAAAEAAILGIPAVAFSATAANGDVDFSRAAKLCRCVLGRLLDVGLAGGDLLNVNLPSLRNPDWPVGVRVARQSTAELQDEYRLTGSAGGRRVYEIAEEYTLGFDGDDADSIALAEGYITVTPLRVDMTHHARLADWQAQNWPDLPHGDAACRGR